MGGLILQLNPYIPVYVPKRDMKGQALGWLDYSQEHNLMWVVALDNSEIWIFENHEVRMQENITLGRILERSNNVGQNTPSTKRA